MTKAIFLKKYMFECLWSKIGQRNFENLVTNDLESDRKS